MDEARVILLMISAFGFGIFVTSIWFERYRR